MNGIVRAVLRHDRLRRRVLAAVVAGGAFAAPTSCDPTTGESTLTGRLSVETSTTCSVEGECDTIHLVVTGERFAPGSHLKIHIPSGQVAGLGAVVIGAEVVVGGSGAFRAVERYAPCTVLARPGDARRVLSLVADDVRADVRRAATFVGSEHVVCRPPFTRLARPTACGSPNLCPTLSTDNSSTIGVHWTNREAGYDRFTIRYAPMDADTWTQTRDLGGDVSSVAVNNLNPGVTYEFELLACHTNFLASSDCTGWVPVGTGATA
jgi:hypothetical protein